MSPSEKSDEAADAATYSVPVVPEAVGPLSETVGDFGDDIQRLAAELSERAAESAPPDGSTIRVSLTDSQQGPRRVSARVETPTGDRFGYYPFVVTDEARQLCAYRKAEGQDVVGYDEVPRSVRRAVARFGWVDETGPSGDGIWFPGYHRTAAALLRDRGEGGTSLLTSELLSRLSITGSALMRALFVMRRYDTPADLPADRSDVLFAEGEDSPLTDAERWIDVPESTLFTQLGAGEWDFDSELLPLPPRKDAERAAVLAEAEQDAAPDTETPPGVTEEVKGRIRETITEHMDSVEAPEADSHDATDDPEGALSDPDFATGLSLDISYPDDEADEQEYVITTIFGGDGIARHEFRVTSYEPRECVYEPRGGVRDTRATAPLPPFAAVHAVVGVGWEPTNVPQFYVDSRPPELTRPPELIENYYRLVDRITDPDRDPTPPGVNRSDLVAPVVETCVSAWMAASVEQDVLSSGVMDKALRAVLSAMQDGTDQDELSDAEVTARLDERSPTELLELFLGILRVIPDQYEAEAQALFTDSWLLRRLRGNDSDTRVADIFAR